MVCALVYTADSRSPRSRLTRQLNIRSDGDLQLRQLTPDESRSDRIPKPSPSPPLDILVRLERLVSAIADALQKLDLFQIAAPAPVRLELRRELGLGGRADVRLPVERGHLQRRQLFPPLSGARGRRRGQLQFRLASAGPLGRQSLRGRRRGRRGRCRLLRRGRRW